MNIFFPITLTPTGGTSTFARKFQAVVATRGHQMSFTQPPHYDVLLVPASCHWRYIRDAQTHHRPIIHRLDGVYYPQSVVGWRYPWHNLPLRVIHQHFATATIYQSQYSKRSCEYFLGSTPLRPEAIVYNGVDLNHFSAGPTTLTLRETPHQQVFITWSRFRRPDQILPLLEAFRWYRRHYQRSCRLIVIGDFVGSVAALPHRLATEPGVSWLGSVPNQELPRYARAADVFLFTHANPPCPNNVLEAMAGGLPVCGVADGAMRELVTPGRNGELVSVRGAGWYRRRTLDLRGFADNLNTIMKRPATYAAASREIAQQRFDVQDMVDRYLAVIRRVLA